MAYDFELPTAFESWPGRTRSERTFVLLDLGVSFANPCWVRHVRPDGTVIDRGAEGRETWYVDLVSIEQIGSRYTFRDLYIDVMVPTDGRHYRLLDLDEFADAIESGLVSTTQAVDALRRWQRFMDRLAYGSRACLRLGGLPTRINSTAAEPTALLTIGEADRVVNRFRRSPRLHKLRTINMCTQVRFCLSWIRTTTRQR